MYNEAICNFNSNYGGIGDIELQLIAELVTFNLCRLCDFVKYDYFGRSDDYHNQLLRIFEEDHNFFKKCANKAKKVLKYFKVD